MLRRFRRYYYEVSYAGHKAGAPEPVKGKVVVEAADLDREFPTKEGPLTPEEQDEQRKAVETYFLAHPPTDVDQVDEHAIERKDEFDEHLDGDEAHLPVDLTPNFHPRRQAGGRLFLRSLTTSS